MKCPYCGSLAHSVIDKRATPDQLAIRRRRQCDSCKKRFSTYERIEQISIMVIKKDLTRVPFSYEKVLSGIQKACQKLPVSPEEQVKMAQAVQAHVFSRQKAEITSHDIGDQVMKQLRRVNKVAYIRFASVYKSFMDLEEFEDELKKLTKK